MRDRARAERLPHRQFARPRRGAGQQQVGDVGAGDEKNQPDDGHEDHQRLGVGRGADRRGRAPWFSVARARGPGGPHSPG